MAQSSWVSFSETDLVRTSRNFPLNDHLKVAFDARGARFAFVRAFPDAGKRLELLPTGFLIRTRFRLWVGDGPRAKHQRTGDNQNENCRFDTIHKPSSFGGPTPQSSVVDPRESHRDADNVVPITATSSTARRSSRLCSGIPGFTFDDQPTAWRAATRRPHAGRSHLTRSEPWSSSMPPPLSDRPLEQIPFPCAISRGV